jgi:hypothetical protein
VVPTRRSEDPSLRDGSERKAGHDTGTEHQDWVDLPNTRSGCFGKTLTAGSRGRAGVPAPPQENGLIGLPPRHCYISGDATRSMIIMKEV